MMCLRPACSDVEYQYESVTISPHNGCLVLSNMSCHNFASYDGEKTLKLICLGCGLLSV